MGSVKRPSIAVTVDMAADPGAAVEDNGRRSVSEVIRNAPRERLPRRTIEWLEVEELRRLVHEGINSGPGIEAGEVFARVRARHGLFGAPLA